MEIKNEMPPKNGVIRRTREIARREQRRDETVHGTQKDEEKQVRQEDEGKRSPADHTHGPFCTSCRQENRWNSTDSYVDAAVGGVNEDSFSTKEQSRLEQRGLRRKNSKAPSTEKSGVVTSPFE